MQAVFFTVDLYIHLRLIERKGSVNKTGERGFTVVSTVKEKKALSKPTTKNSIRIFVQKII